MSQVGDEAKSLLLQSLSDALSSSLRPAADVRQIQLLLGAAESLLTGAATSLDIKIASSALQEMTEAFEMFAPYRDIRKVTMFGSARTTPDSPIYESTVEVARQLADDGFMVVTGAGPGLMEAAMVGAGRERSIGVSIRLPFESGANPIIAGDEKYVSMRYFFTRKLMLVKESHAFVCLPGGFGTLDETFELITLAQTAKTVPVPIIFLDTPGQAFWRPLMAAMEPLLLERGLISPDDTSLYDICSDTASAADVIHSFYANYDSLRVVRGDTYLRIKRPVPADAFAEIAKRHSHISNASGIRQAEASREEQRDNDLPHLPRVVLRYTGKGWAALRPLINDLNRF